MFINCPPPQVATGGWTAQEAPNGARVQSLLEHYRAVAQRDKMEREKRRLAASKLKTSVFRGEDKTSLSPGQHFITFANFLRLGSLLILQIVTKILTVVSLC